MSHRHGKKKTEEQSSRAIETDESHIEGLVTGDSLAQESHSVEPQQRPVTPEPEQPDVRATRTTLQQTGQDRIQSPARVAGTSGTATQVPDASRESTIDSSGGQLIGDQPDIDNRTSITVDVPADDTGFMVPSADVARLHKEYDEFTSLQINAEIVLTEAITATERLSTVLKQMKTFNNRMSPSLRKLFNAFDKQSSGKTIEFGNNRTRDQAAAQAATERVVSINTTNVTYVTASNAPTRLNQSRIIGEDNANAPSSRPVNIPSPVNSERSEGSQLRILSDAEIYRARCANTDSQLRILTDTELNSGHRVNTEFGTRDARLPDVRVAYTTAHRHENVNPTHRGRGPDMIPTYTGRERDTSQDDTHH